MDFSLDESVEPKDWGDDESLVDVQNEPKEGKKNDSSDVSIPEADEPANLDTGRKSVEDINEKQDEQTKTEDDVKTEKVESAFSEGDVIEFEGKDYTIDNKGNLIDENGNIFKKAEELEEFIKSCETVEDKNDKTAIESVISSLGVNITDENGKIIEFENTEEGIKSYVDSVIELNKKSHQEEALNTLFSKFPFVAEVIQYYTANGNSLEGFNQIRDLSSVELDLSNETQCESIVRLSFQEQGRTDIEAYIAYLKSSGSLSTVAQQEFENLKKADESKREELAKKAEEEEQRKAEENKKYWDNVQAIVKKGELGKYVIPETFTIEKNGVKLGSTRDDFFRYLYQVDKDGKSGYDKDLEKISIDQAISEEILRAFLIYTGGDYSSLINYEVNKQVTKKLKLSEQKGNTAGRVVIKKQSTGTNPKNKGIGFGDSNLDFS